MNVPIDKIFMMLSYAAGCADLASLESVEAAGDSGPSEYLGMLLAEAGERSLRAGLPQHYSPMSTKGRSLRGRIDFPQQIKSDLCGGVALCCIADELGHDTTNARLIKTAAVRLALSKHITALTAARLQRLARSLRCEPLPRLSSHVLAPLTTSRASDVHRAAVFVAWLAIAEQGFAYGDNGIVFGWPTSPQQLGWLFQEFVRQKLLVDCRVGIDVHSDTYSLHLAAGVGAARDILPQLRTDVVLVSATEVVVVEAKLMLPLVGGRWPSNGTQRIRAGHLAQLLAYLEHASSRYPGRRIRGVLLYGASAPRVLARFPLRNYEISVISLDLRASISQVLADLARVSHLMDNDDALGIEHGGLSIAT